MSNLDGKAVVVTGAGRGLGQAFAMHLAEIGAGVVVNDIDADAAERTTEEIKSLGGAAVTSTHSVADADQAGEIVEQCVDTFGAIDGLVNNAGLTYELPAWEEEPDRMRELIEVNVLGVLFTGIAAIRAMRATGGGSIVNISSGASLGQRTLASYSASKGAVASVTYSWALDLEAIGIRVNAVCPLARTRMVWSSDRAMRKCPPGWTPDRVAPLVAFLLGDSSAGITGQMIRLAGDQLHVVGQPYLKPPIVERAGWNPATVEQVFNEVFAAHLEPYGLEKRQPPRLRTWLAPEQPGDPLLPVQTA
jgi:NAD(P)-dependent dehydrogenase (short-subunit alcohol dehydrogenase family)